MIPLFAVDFNQHLCGIQFCSYCQKLALVTQVYYSQHETLVSFSQ